MLAHSFFAKSVIRYKGITSLQPVVDDGFEHRKERGLAPNRALDFDLLRVVHPSIAHRGGVRQAVALQRDTLKSRVINIEWANMQKFLRVILVALCVPMLVSCGGEIWDEPGVVSVTVTAAPGMTGLELGLRSPDFFTESISIPSAGRYKFSRVLAPNSSSFWVDVTTQPVNGECTVVDERGIIFSTQIFKWTVNCRISQTISWSQDYTPSGGTVSLTATASSGLPVSFVDRTSAPAVSGCSLVGNQLTYLSPGASCTIAAIQAGSDDYFPATEISQVFVNPL